MLYLSITPFLDYHRLRAPRRRYLLCHPATARIIAVRIAPISIVDPVPSAKKVGFIRNAIQETATVLQANPRSIFPRRLLRKEAIAHHPNVETRAMLIASVIESTVAYFVTRIHVASTASVPPAIPQARVKPSLFRDNKNCAPIVPRNGRMSRPIQFTASPLPASQTLFRISFFESTTTVTGSNRK